MSGLLRDTDHGGLARTTMVQIAKIARLTRSGCVPGDIFPQGFPHFLLKILQLITGQRPKRDVDLDSGIAA